VLHRATPTGTEDFVSFETRPSVAEVAYQLATKGAAGLRLIANTLELLDAEGTPRLRVAPPYLIGADQAKVDATLSIEGCAVDTNPAAPWGPAPVAPGAEKCNLRITWSNDGVVYPALLDPTWSRTGSMAVARQAHTSTMLSTGKVLVAGGLGTSGSALNSAELYNPATKTWSSAASMADARQLHSAVQLGTSSNMTTSGKVLVAGGKSGSSSTRTPGGVLEYRFSAGAVEQLSSAGARFGPIAPGPTGFPIFQGQQFVIPTEGFGLFNSLRSEGQILVLPR
jgi:hypothetical protein